MKKRSEPPTPKWLIVCSVCGSSNMTSDANASWDVEEQQWVLDDVTGDYYYCANCGDEASADDLELNSLEEANPVGTERALLIDDITGHDLSLPYRPPLWTDPVPYGIATSNQEKYYITDITGIRPGDLVVLKKINAWQWEVVK